MTLIITDNRVSDKEAYLPLAKAFAKESLNEKGCHEINVYNDTETADRVVFVSKWDSKEDFLATVGGDIFNKHIPAMGPYYVSGTDTFLELVE